MWTENLREHNTPMHQFKSDNVTVSLYQVRKSCESESDAKTYHFHTTMKPNNMQFEGYFQAKDIDEAKNITQLMLYQNLLAYRKLIDQTIQEVQNFIGEDIGAA